MKSIPTRNLISFKIQKKDNKYVLVFNTPFPLEIVNIGNFSKIFRFEQTIRKDDKILPNTDYVSENILDLLSPLSVIEWHCNIAKYSYANHDDLPHIRKQEELLHMELIEGSETSAIINKTPGKHPKEILLLHISFLDNNFYEKPV